MQACISLSMRAAKTLGLYRGLAKPCGAWSHWEAGHAHQSVTKQSQCSVMHSSQPRLLAQPLLWQACLQSRANLTSLATLDGVGPNPFPNLKESMVAAHAGRTESVRPEACCSGPGECQQPQPHHSIPDRELNTDGPITSLRAEESQKRPAEAPLEPKHSGQHSPKQTAAVVIQASVLHLLLQD